MRFRTRIKNVAILAGLYWGLSYVSNIVESLYFHVLPALDAVRGVAGGLGIAVLVACILEWRAPAKNRQEDSLVTSAPRLWWRIPLLGVLFFLIYLIAGMAIHPWIASFYQNRPLPSLGQLAAWQFCRGLLDTACIFPLLHVWTRSRRRAVWLSAYVFTVLCAWGPLLLPNRFLPGPIRLAHAVEMGVSGILFGIATAMLLLKPASFLSAEITRPDNSHLAV
jgi:hypothetical protein